VVGLVGGVQFALFPVVARLDFYYTSRIDIVHLRFKYYSERRTPSM
jgi:hypothetical protein